MANFDKNEALGETITIIKDLSLGKNFATATGQTLWTGNGKR
jgi:hypothetical protein